MGHVCLPGQRPHPQNDSRSSFRLNDSAMLRKNFQKIKGFFKIFLR